jgi:hypothetical protein
VFAGVPFALPDTMTSTLPHFEPNANPIPDRPGTVSVELTDNATPEHHTRAQHISAAWVHGAYDTARTLLDSLSAEGVLIGAGFSWEETGHLENGYNPDRRVGGTRTDPRAFAIDYNPANNHIFVAVQWPEGWTLNRSINGGFTWTETFFWSSSSPIVDIDMVIAGDFAYVGYIPANGQSVRLRRNTLPAGTEDAAYFFETVFTGSGAQIPFAEVAVESNIDDFNNRLYAAALQNDGALRFMFSNPATATSFTEDSPLIPGCLGDIADSNGVVGASDGQVDFGDLIALFGAAGPCPGGTPGCTGDIADSNGVVGNFDGQVDFGDLLALLGLSGPCTNFGVAGSLDMHWNASFDDYFLFLSYRTTQNQIQIQRALSGFSNVWEISQTIPVASSNGDVGISAFDDTVIVAYETRNAQSIRDIRYNISYNAGNTYSVGFTTTTPPSKFNVDVTARRGYGTAVVTTGEVSEPDDVYLNRRAGYAPGGWVGFLKFNSEDVVTGDTPLAIQALPASGTYNYGMMYRGSDGNAYFDRLAD